MGFLGACWRRVRGTLALDSPHCLSIEGEAGVEEWAMMTGDFAPLYGEGAWELLVSDRRCMRARDVHNWCRSDGLRHTAGKGGRWLIKSV